MRISKDYEIEETWITIIVVFISTFILLLKASARFKFLAKIIYFYVVVGLTTAIVLLPYLLLRPRRVENLRAVASLWNFSFKILGVDIILKDGQNLECDEPYILVCNHQSGLDFIGMFKVLPNRMTILAKKELLYTGPFGLAAWLSGLVFIDRFDKDNARSTMVDTAKLLHDKNLKLWIFPEGTRKLTGEIHSFKKGAFHLAIQGQIPIIPVVMSSYQSFYNPSKWIFESGKVIFKCLPPISTEGLDVNDVNELTEMTRDEMITAFKVISEESAKLNAKNEHLLGKTK